MFVASAESALISEHRQIYEGKIGTAKPRRVGVNVERKQRKPISFQEGKVNKADATFSRLPCNAKKSNENLARRSICAKGGNHDFYAKFVEPV